MKKNIQNISILLLAAIVILSIITLFWGGFAVGGLVFFIFPIIVPILILSIILSGDYDNNKPSMPTWFKFFSIIIIIILIMVFGPRFF
jgi:4-hydroxybenzoate polyprenyltransferase